MAVTQEQLNELEDRIEHAIRNLVDDHKLSRGFSEVAKRNMAYCGAGAAVSALQPKDLGIAI